MGTAHYEDGTALFFTLEYVDVAVVRGAFDAVVVFAQFLDLSNTFAEYDRFLEAATAAVLYSSQLPHFNLKSRRRKGIKTTT
jgi:hypothetical protein